MWRRSGEEVEKKMRRGKGEAGERTRERERELKG
jgi:hypothetical protein